MANYEFNVAHGRTAEYVARVNSNDPANSAIVIVLLANTGLESRAVLQDKDTLADVLAGSTNEATNTGYARIVYNDTSGMNVTINDTDDRLEVDMPDPSWASISNDGTGQLGALLVCYDPDTTAGTDANIIPLTHHDFVHTPSGNPVTAGVSTGGFVFATSP